MKQAAAAVVVIADMKLDQLWVAGGGVGAHAPACSNGASHGSGTSSVMHPMDGDNKHVIAPFHGSLLQWG